MKRFFNFFLLAIALVTLFSIVSDASGGEVQEYIITKDADEYVLSAYSGDSNVPLVRSASFDAISSYISALDGAEVVFGGVEISESIEIYGSGCRLSGSLIMTGGAGITLNADRVEIKGMSLESFGGGIRIKRGSLNFYDSEIYSHGARAVVIDYSAAAEFFMHSGEIHVVGASEAIWAEKGCVTVTGGKISCQDGAAIATSSTLTLSGTPEIVGADVDVIASSPITLSDKGVEFAGRLDVKYLESFSKGSIKCVFYSASESSISQIKLYDADTSEMRVVYFDSYSQIDEKNFAAVYLPYTAKFYSDEILISTAEITSGMTLECQNPPDKSGYEFLGWYDSGENIYDFAEEIRSDIVLNARYRLLPPTFALSSIEFTYDGMEREFGLCDISHPLLEGGILNFLWYRNGVFISDGGPTLKAKTVSDSDTYTCTLTFTTGTDTVSVTTPEISVRVNKANVSLPSVTSKVYTGEYQSPDIYSTKIYTVSLSGGVLVGVYPVKLTLTDSENYEFVGGGDVAYLNFEIKKSDNFFTDGLSVSDVYEGVLPRPMATSRFGEVEYLYSTASDGVYTDEIPKAAGEYFCIAVADGSENYGPLRSEPMKFKVIAEEIVGISIATLPEKVKYKSFEMFIPDGLTFSITYNSKRSEIIDGGDVLFRYQSAPNFRFGDNAIIASYRGATIAVPVSVEKAEYDISGIIFKDSSVIYDGSIKSIDYHGVLPMGLDGIPLEAKTAGGGKNAGSYNVTLSFYTSSKEYKIPESINAVLTVMPYEAMAVFPQIDFVYDGFPKCPEAYYTDIYGRKVPLIVSGARSYAGEYIAEAMAEDENYKILNSVAVFKIAKANYDFSGVAWSNGKFTYDGETKGVSISGLPIGVSVVGYADNVARDAGKYTARAVFIYDEKNYNPPPDITYEWEIFRAEYDQSIFSFNDATYVYDGNMHLPEFFGEMPMGADGVYLEYSFCTGVTNVAEGRVLVEIKFHTESKNYSTPESIYRYVEITPAEIVVSWSGIEFVYDTGEHLPRAEATECEVKVLGAKKDAGNYTATAVSLNTDYRVINDKVDFVIKKARNLWTRPLSVSDIFEGRNIEPYAQCIAGEVEYVYYDDMSNEPLSAPPSLPGKYYVLAKSDGNNNYSEIISGRVQFEIIAVVPVSMTLTMHKTEFSAFETILPTDFTVTFENNDGTVTSADTSLFNISYSSAESFRYEDTYAVISYLGFSERITVSVKKADYDMTSVRWSAESFVYDGEEKRVTLIGLPEGVTVGEYVGASAVFAGSYRASATLVYDTENYNPPRIEDVIFVINKRKIDLPNIPLLIYNGKEQIPCVPSSELYTAEYEGATYRGLYPVVIKLTDKANYAFSDMSDTAVIYYEIAPTRLTVTLSDVDKYLLSGYPKPDYTVTEGEIFSGDSLELKFTYTDGAVGCISENPNYEITVITGRVIKHRTVSPDGLFWIFLVFLSLVALSLILYVIISRRERIFQYISLVKCRISPTVNSESEEGEENEVKAIDDDSSEGNSDTNLDAGLSVDVERADSLITDSLAKELVRKEDIKIETDGTKKGIINVDTLSRSFNSGDSVDVNKLKEMSLVPYDTAYIKVLARGMIDKPLKVYANDFSLSAVKMIALTGGEAVRVITVKKKEKK